MSTSPKHPEILGTNSVDSTPHRAYVQALGTVRELRVFQTRWGRQATCVLADPNGAGVLVWIIPSIAHRVLPWIAEGERVLAAGKLYRPEVGGPAHIKAQSLKRFADLRTARRASLC